MILVRPQEAAKAIGSSCERYDGSDSQSLLELLRDLTPRVEDALNVKTLERGSFTETFRSPVAGSHKMRLYLANGFIVPGSAVIAGVSSLTEDGPALPLILDEEYGTLEFSGYFDGTETFTVTYSSGFEVEAAPVAPVADNAAHIDRNYRCYLGVPDWLRSIVDAMLVRFYRVRLLNPLGLPKGANQLNQFALSEGLNKELKSMVYQRYQRPRFNLQPAAKYVKNG